MTREQHERRFKLVAANLTGMKQEEFEIDHFTIDNIGRYRGTIVYDYCGCKEYESVHEYSC